jgi:hypothetical protein
LTTADLLVCALVAAFGIVPFIFYQRAPDFLYPDVFYVELGRSLLFQGSYSFNGLPENVQPPGLPIIFGLACSTIGCTHDILIRTMPVFLTLGFILSYVILRRALGTLTAAAFIFLLVSSPNLFPYVTTQLWPSFPFFFVTMLFLVLAPKVDTLKNPLWIFFAGCLLCILLTGAVMIQSVGIALIGAYLGYTVFLFLRDAPAAKSHLRIAAPVLLVAVLTQALWIQRGGNPQQWPVHGYPESYLAQLKLKNGNYPDLGFASAKDVVFRVEKNVKERTAFFAEVLTHHWIRFSWASPLVSGVIVLIVCGVWSSLLRSNTQLCALYFVAYEGIYLLWPWSFDVPRFTIPTLPLACLYLAEGAVTLWGWSQQRPRIVGSLLLPMSIGLAFLATKGWATGHGLQDKMSAVFWAICTATFGRMIWKGSLLPSGLLMRMRGFFGKPWSLAGVPFGPIQGLAILSVAYLVAAGVAEEIPMGRENLTSGTTKFENTPEIQAALWLEAHTDPSAIIASRGVPLVHYYSKRRVISFPPTSDTKLLMHGIRNHHIGYVIVIDREFTYYFPSETVCFELLDKAYPDTFHLVDKNSQLRIYEVRPESVRLPN